MNPSHYFEELSSAYSAEIDDLTSDFEGKTVLSARLLEKRQAIGTMLQMIDAAPEMVLPIFHGAFTFHQPAALVQAAQAEPDDEDFPAWESIAAAVGLADWAQPMARQVLAEPDGDRFMVSAAVVEYLRLRDYSAPESTGEGAESGNKSERNNGDDGGKDDEGDDSDLAEAGADWLAEQGFDSHSG